jgi:hypothetical protein
MANANPVGMPLDANVKLVPNPEDNELNWSNAYAKLLGALQYITNFTWLDILYAVNLHYESKPSTLWHPKTDTQVSGRNERSWNHLQVPRKWQNQYTLSQIQWFEINHQISLSIIWRSDNLEIKEANSNHIIYRIRIHSFIWSCMVEKSLQRTRISSKGSCHNQRQHDGSVILTHNPQFHQWSKHIQIHHHWIRDLIQEKMLDMNYCSDAEKMADVLMKPLSKPKHIKHTAEMGLKIFL